MNSTNRCIGISYVWLALYLAGVDLLGVELFASQNAAWLLGPLVILGLALTKNGPLRPVRWLRVLWLWR
ncbi:hypothetical protein D3C85_1151880 [compost metagenome]